MRFSFPDFSNLHPFILVSKYYVGCVVLTIVAYSCNKSFLTQHPNQIFPTIISPPWNRTLHSIKPTTRMEDHIHTRSPLSPSYRRWLSPRDLLSLKHLNLPPPRAITLSGDLSGPPLCQGMIILQKNYLIYLQEEHGWWPSRDDHILTTAFSIKQGVTFKLFIPLHYFNRQNIFDESPRSLLENSIPLTFFANGVCQFKTILP